MGNDLAPIAGVQLSLMKLSRELAVVSRQIRILAAAFAAVSTENGAVVVHVLQDSSGVWLQNEYGYFETWTQAQGVRQHAQSSVWHLIRVEAQHIVVSASLAAASSSKQKSWLRLPALLFAQFRDVRGVMPAVPGIQEKQPVHRAHTVVRMPERSRKVLCLQRAQQPHPAFMQGIQQRETNIDRRRLGVLQLRPTRLFVGFDRGLLLRQRQPEPHVRIHVAVRNVMRHLPYCPAAVAIGRVQLLFAQALYGGAQLGGRLRDGGNRLAPQSRRNVLRR